MSECDRISGCADQAENDDADQVALKAEMIGAMVIEPDHAKTEDAEDHQHRRSTHEDPRPRAQCAAMMQPWDQRERGGQRNKSQGVFDLPISIEELAAHAHGERHEEAEPPEADAITVFACLAQIERHRRSKQEQQQPAGKRTAVDGVGK